MANGGSASVSEDANAGNIMPVLNKEEMKFFLFIVAIKIGNNRIVAHSLLC